MCFKVFSEDKIKQRGTMHVQGSLIPHYRHQQSGLWPWRRRSGGWPAVPCLRTAEEHRDGEDPQDNGVNGHEGKRTAQPPQNTHTHTDRHEVGWQTHFHWISYYNDALDNKLVFLLWWTGNSGLDWQPVKLHEDTNDMLPGLSVCEIHAASSLGHFWAKSELVSEYTHYCALP